MSNLNHQGSGTQPLSRDPNSKRTKRRKNRNFQGSRTTRRAADRLARRGYIPSTPESGHLRKKPGKMDKH